MKYVYLVVVVLILKEGVYEFSVGAYYKKMNNLIEYKEGAGFLGTTSNWGDLVESNGQGTSYGLELLLQKKNAKPRVGQDILGQKQIGSSKT